MGLYRLRLKRRRTWTINGMPSSRKLIYTTDQLNWYYARSQTQASGSHHLMYKAPSYTRHWHLFNAFQPSRIWQIHRSFPYFITTLLQALWHAEIQWRAWQCQTSILPSAVLEPLGISGCLLVWVERWLQERCIKRSTCKFRVEGRAICLVL